MLGARVRLDLAGHALSGDSFAGIECVGACSVVGPGAVTGFNVGVAAERGSVKVDGVDFATYAIGILSQRTVQAKNATFTGHQNSAIEARQAVKVENCTFAGNGNAVSSSSTVKLTSSTITGGAFGLNTRGANLIDSTIDTTTDGGNGPDIVTLSRPRLVRSTCAGTSKRRYDPVASWGVCALD